MNARTHLHTTLAEPSQRDPCLSPVRKRARHDPHAVGGTRTSGANRSVLGWEGFISFHSSSRNLCFVSSCFSSGPRGCFQWRRGARAASWSKGTGGWVQSDADSECDASSVEQKPKTDKGEQGKERAGSPFPKWEFIYGLRRYGDFLMAVVFSAASHRGERDSDADPSSRQVRMVGLNLLFLRACPMGIRMRCKGNAWERNATCFFW
ncbi:hypothetical protein K438DRAFT_769691 [Mycena galopus ATCC 62051]|nr:hypothetical protein K438DRAFT_769691 [Mycena galopus ATCC 62051]